MSLEDWAQCAVPLPHNEMLIVAFGWAGGMVTAFIILAVATHKAWRD